MDETIERIKKETDIFSKAKLIKYLLREKNIKLLDLAKKLHITPSYLCHLNRLNRLPEIIVDGYYSKLIKLSHLFVISRVKEEDKLIKIYEQVLSNNLTIKQTEDLIREIVYEIKDKGNFINKDEKEKLLTQVKEKYNGVIFQITQSRTRAKVLIEIKGSLEETSKKIKKIISGLILVKDS